MKLNHIFPFIIVTMSVFFSMAKAENVSISIDEIVTNERITGYISDINKEERNNYKVVVYAHTDQWYIHPYAGQGEGLSWASINENGIWRIETVQRRFKADRVAALLVKRGYPEPNKVIDLDRIPYTAIVIMELKETPDYGKL